MVSTTTQSWPLNSFWPVWYAVLGICWLECGLVHVGDPHHHTGLVYHPPPPGHRDQNMGKNTVSHGKEMFYSVKHGRYLNGLHRPHSQLKCIPWIFFFFNCQDINVPGAHSTLYCSDKTEYLTCQGFCYEPYDHNGTFKELSRMSSISKLKSNGLQINIYILPRTHTVLECV